MASSTVGPRYTRALTLLLVNILFVLFITGPCDARTLGSYRQFVDKKPPNPRRSIAEINAKARPVKVSSETRGVQRLAGVTHQLGFCGFPLRLNGQTLNKNNVRLSTSQAVSKTLSIYPWVSL